MIHFLKPVIRALIFIDCPTLFMFLVTKRENDKIIRKLV